MHNMSHVIDLSPPPRSLGLNDGDLYEKDVIVKLMNGARVSGKLLEINGPLQKITIQNHQATEILNLPYRDVRYLLVTPVKELDGKSESEACGLSGSGDTGSGDTMHTQKIHIKYNDGITAECYVFGYTVDIYGLQLFREIDAIKIIRIFIPVTVITSYRIGKLLGEIVTGQNLVDKSALEESLQQQKHCSAVNPEQVEKTKTREVAFAGQTENIIPRIGEILKSNSKISDVNLHKAIARKFGLPYIDLHHLNIDPALVDLIPADIARKYLMVPVSIQKNYLTIAMEDPGNVEAIHMIQFITGLQPEIVISSRQGIEAALSVLYDPLQQEHVNYVEEKTEEPENISVQKLGEQKPIVRLTTNILTEAIRRRASDIHIRPAEKKFILLFRIDGNLIRIRDFSKSLLAGVVSRIKILGRMDISERRVPQDGRTRIIHEGSVVDLRISIIPTVDGESVVIRLLNIRMGIKTLESLNFSKEDLVNIRGMLNKMHGLILVTGPTGSGKSTTLYAALNEVIGRNLNIITVEDPVEYHLEGIEQIQVNNITGLTFARVLRNVLRHDPDIIMIGEIRDEETARIAIQSSLTGHLVLSTLHTNSAVGAITRLKDMNIEPYLLAPTLLCILAQRLIKCICPDCLGKNEVPEHVQKLLNLDRSENFYYGKGCEKCNNTGYSGRMAIYELLMINQKLRNAVKGMESESSLQAIARQSGMISLADNGLARAREGRITIAEVYRITQDN